MGIAGSVDLGDKSAEEIERASGHIEPGWYLASVIDVYEEEGNLKLKFRFRDGREFTETLWDPMGAEDDKKAKKSQDRRNLFSIRLGLVPREAKGGVFNFDWLDAIGRDCALKMSYGPKKDNGAQYANIEWAGIFEPGDSRVPPELRQSAAGSVAPQAASQPANGHTPPANRPALAGASAGGSRQLNLDDL